MDILMHGRFANVKVRKHSEAEWYLSFGPDDNDLDRGSMWVTREDARELVRVLSELLETGELAEADGGD